MSSTSLALSRIGLSLPLKTRGHGYTNYGKDDYCAISFNGLQPGDRPVLIGWMSNWQYADKLPASPWRGQMSLPRQPSVMIWT